ncbi:MAG: glycosyltransferase [Ferruginibacter sp.]
MPAIILKKFSKANLHLPDSQGIVTNMPPLVSICIPNYNKAGFIEECIESVYRQTYRNIELFIIDDGSTDNSVAIIKNKISNGPFKTTLLQNEKNSGICYSLNNALKIASGKYYQMLGSDDLILPGKIASQVAIFESLPEEYAIVFGKSYRMDEAGNYLEDDYYQSIDVDTSKLKHAGFEDLLSINFISSCAHLVKFAAIVEAGMYDESLRVEDWDLWLRIAKKYKVLFINEYDSVYRIVNSSLTHNLKNFADVYTTYCKTLLKHLDYSPTGNRNIARNIGLMSLVVYKYDGQHAKELLKKSFQLNRNPKSFILLVSSYFGLQYRFLKTLTFSKKHR